MLDRQQTIRSIQCFDRNPYLNRISGLMMRSVVWNRFLFKTFADRFSFGRVCGD